MRLFDRICVLMFCSFAVIGSAEMYCEAADAPSTSSAATEQDASKPETSAKPYGIEKRTPWTTSRIVGSPEPPLPYRLKRRFEKLTFSQPVHMIPEPASNREWILEREGKIFAFENNNDTSERFLVGNLARDEYVTESYSLLFHPEFEKNGYVYAFINVRKNKPEAVDGKPVTVDEDSAEYKRYDRIERYEVSRNQPCTLSPETRAVIIEWYSSGHDGGGMAFGADGMLYITTGDGTSGSDTDNTGQDIADLRGSILRIDVDSPSEERLYGIPKDNPFLHIKDARPEVYAFGLRAPWRMSYDPPTGNLWVGEVGQDLWEMIHLVRRGANYGWSVREGNHSFYPERKIGPAAIVPPIVEHHHSESRSITGGYVYRGKKRQELFGRYIYCDYETGKVWALHYENGQVLSDDLLADTSYKVATFGIDHDQEIYLVALSGEIFELEPSTTKVDPREVFPVQLSQTGLFESTADMRPAPGLIPYSVNAPVWTDGARIERYMAVADDAKITVNANRGWGLTDGSVAVQTLSLDMDSENPESGRRIETRILTRRDGEWEAYTYAWNDDQTDAKLVEKGGGDRTFEIRDESADGGVRKQTWHLPSRTECMACHSRAANWVLGLTTLQMNRDHDYGQVTDNQLRTLEHIGLFEKPLEKPPEDLPALADPYAESGDLHARARSYLHANCSHCHVDNGGGNARMELEFQTDNEKTDLFGVRPTHGTFNILSGQLIAPHHPYRSILLYRMSKLGRGRMPHLGSSVVDERAIGLFHDWVAGLPADFAMKPESASVDDNALHQGDARALDMVAGSDAVNTAAVERLLSTSSGALMLLRAIDSGRLSASVSADAINRGAVHSDINVRDLFERFLPEDQRMQRLGTVFDSQMLLNLPGDVARGEAFFFKTTGAQCQNCHTINGKGKELGPDLSKIGKKLDRVKILESIVEPSRTIDEKFATYLIETVEGRVHTGLLLSKTDEQVVLKDSQSRVIKVRTNDVEFMAKQKKSLMPELQLRDLTAQQAADLIEYLGSLK